jgi:hypothetical protein
VVLETGFEESLNENLTGQTVVRRGGKRAHKSVDKEGRTIDEGGLNSPSNPNAANYISETGMGWFPGYAINIETGERLNIAFGECSYYREQNGADMKWNPTSAIFSNTGGIQLGGLHFIYVFNHNVDYGTISSNQNPGPEALMPKYDECRYINTKLSIPEPANLTGINNLPKRQVFRDCIWAGFNILTPNEKLLSNTATVKLRVNKPYARYSAAYTYNDYYVNKAGTALVEADSIGVKVANPKNDNYPFYSFNTKNIATIKESKFAGENALNLINVVPNPYYAYSEYELNQLTNLVKITNLPVTCTVSIYNINGTLIRRIQKDDKKATYLDWDLKNNTGIPIASGLYYIHVDAGDLGEKTIKWFGALRPVDLNAF